MESAYIESTIPSYCIARPSRNPILLARHQITQNWWHNQRKGYDLYLSQIVLDEIAVGEQAKASLRLELVREINLLDIDEESIAAAETLIETGILPKNAAQDALHISIASVHEIDYLITWDCKHIANPHITTRI